MLISIIIPTYNRSYFIKQALDSILVQYNIVENNCEIIIVDDGSVDDTFDVVFNYLSHPFIYYYKIQNNGVSFARNYGVKYAKGDWILFLDSDDKLFPNSLEKIINNIENNPKIDVYYYGIERIDASGNSILIFPNENRYFAKIPGTFVISKNLFLKENGYDIRLKFSENTELFFRLSNLNIRQFYSNDVTLSYYDNPDGGSKNIKNSIDSLIIILNKHSNVLSSFTTSLYLKIIGVNYLRLGNYSLARKYLWNSFKLTPFNYSVFIRLLISLFPFFASIVYKR